MKKKLFAFILFSLFIPLFGNEETVLNKVFETEIDESIYEEILALISPKL